MRFTLLIVALCPLFLSSAVSADWFSCWPQDAEGGHAEERTTHTALGIELRLASEWTREVSQVRFMASFKHENGSLLTVTRQHREAGLDILTKLEKRDLGRPWLGQECHEIMESWLPHLPEVKVRAYRSVIKMRTWSAHMVVVFSDGEDWVVVRLKERWRKHDQRLGPGEVEMIIKSLQIAMKS